MAELEVIRIGILLSGEVEPIPADDEDDLGEVLHFCRLHLEQAMLAGMPDAAFRPGIEEVVDEPGGL